MITLDKLHRKFSGVTVVDQLSLEIPSGEIAVLVGPSGCGKTTTLRMINRLVQPTSGRVLIDGDDVASRSTTDLRRSIGYVIQQVGLFPHLSIAENVATVPRLLRWDKKRIADRVDHLLNLVGLPPAQFAKRYPTELSGGQKQRVGVARALGADPPVLLMDEPFGAIDPVGRGRLQDELLRLQSHLHKTIVFVTHDIDEAIKMGDRIALLKEGGQLVQYASPAEMLQHPADDYAVRFLGSTRTLRRLALLPLRDFTSQLRDGARPEASIDVKASLRDALDACMRSPSGSVAVVSGAEHLGNIDIEIIRWLSR